MLLNLQLPVHFIQTQIQEVTWDFFIFLMSESLFFWLADVYNNDKNTSHIKHESFIHFGVTLWLP